MATLEQIQAKLKKLQAQAEALLVKKSQAAIDEIRSLMEKHGLTAADIDAPAAGKKRGPKPVAKSVRGAKTSAVQYQDPRTGATWSGRGRAPGWIAKARDRSRFLVGESALSSAAVAARQPATMCVVFNRKNTGTRKAGPLGVGAGARRLGLLRRKTAISF